jgi:hypothetical protein
MLPKIVLNTVLLVVSIGLFLTAILVEPSSENNLYLYLIFFSNILMFHIGLYVVFTLKFAINETLSFANNHLIFPMTRFDLFKREFKIFLFNPFLILLLISFSSVLFKILSPEISFDLILRISLSLILQFCFFIWLLLFIKLKIKDRATGISAIGLTVISLSTLSTVGVSMQNIYFQLNPFGGCFYGFIFLKTGQNFIDYLIYLLTVSIIYLVTVFLTKINAKWAL